MKDDVSLNSRSNPSVVRVHIKASKTDLSIRGSYVSDNELCPVAVVVANLVVRGGLSGLFFRYSSVTPLSRELLVKHVRAALLSYGMDVSKYSGYSFRIGAATAVSAMGVEDSMMKTLGWWQSSAYQSYVRIPRNSLAAVSKRLSEA